MPVCQCRSSAQVKVMFRLPLLQVLLLILLSLQKISCQNTVPAPPFRNDEPKSITASSDAKHDDPKWSQFFVLHDSNADGSVKPNGFFYEVRNAPPGANKFNNGVMKAEESHERLNPIDGHHQLNFKSNGKQPERPSTVFSSDKEHVIRPSDLPNQGVQFDEPRQSNLYVETRNRRPLKRYTAQSTIPRPRPVRVFEHATPRRTLESKPQQELSFKESTAKVPNQKLSPTYRTVTKIINGRRPSEHRLINLPNSTLPLSRKNFSSNIPDQQRSSKRLVTNPFPNLKRRNPNISFRGKIHESSTIPSKYNAYEDSDVKTNRPRATVFARLNTTANNPNIPRRPSINTNVQNPLKQRGVLKRRNHRRRPRPNNSVNGSRHKYENNNHSLNDEPITGARYDGRQNTMGRIKLPSTETTVLPNEQLLRDTSITKIHSVSPYNVKVPSEAVEFGVRIRQPDYFKNTNTVTKQIPRRAVSHELSKNGDKLQDVIKHTTLSDVEHTESIKPKDFIVVDNQKQNFNTEYSNSEEPSDVSTEPINSQDKYKSVVDSRNEFLEKLREREFIGNDETAQNTSGEPKYFPRVRPPSYPYNRSPAPIGPSTRKRYFNLGSNAEQYRIPRTQEIQSIPRRPIQRTRLLPDSHDKKPQTHSEFVRNHAYGIQDLGPQSYSNGQISASGVSTTSDNTKTKQEDKSINPSIKLEEETDAKFPIEDTKESSFFSPSHQTKISPRANFPQGFVHTQLQLPPLNFRFHLMPVKETNNDSASPFQNGDYHLNPNYRVDPYQQTMQFLPSKAQGGVTSERNEYQPPLYQYPIQFQPPTDPRQRFQEQQPYYTQTYIELDPNLRTVNREETENFFDMHQNQQPTNLSNKGDIPGLSNEDLNSKSPTQQNAIRSHHVSVHKQPLPPLVTAIPSTIADQESSALYRREPQNITITLEIPLLASSQQENNEKDVARNDSLQNVNDIAMPLTSTVSSNVSQKNETDILNGNIVNKNISSEKIIELFDVIRTVSNSTDSSELKIVSANSGTKIINESNSIKSSSSSVVEETKGEFNDFSVEFKSETTTEVSLVVPLSTASETTNIDSSPQDSTLGELSDLKPSDEVTRVINNTTTTTEEPKLRVTQLTLSHDSVFGPNSTLRDTIIQNEDGPSTSPNLMETTNEIISHTIGSTSTLSTTTNIDEVSSTVLGETVEKLILKDNDDISFTPTAAPPSLPETEKTVLATQIPNTILVTTKKNQLASDFPGILIFNEAQTPTNRIVEKSSRFILPGGLSVFSFVEKILATNPTTSSNILSETSTLNSDTTEMTLRQSSDFVSDSSKLDLPPSTTVEHFNSVVTETTTSSTIQEMSRATELPSMSEDMQMKTGDTDQEKTNISTASDSVGSTMSSESLTTDVLPAKTFFERLDDGSIKSDNFLIILSDEKNLTDSSFNVSNLESVSFNKLVNKNETNDEVNSTLAIEFHNYLFNKTFTETNSTHLTENEKVKHFNVQAFSETSSDTSENTAKESISEMNSPDLPMLLSTEKSSTTQFTESTTKSDILKDETQSIADFKIQESFTKGVSTANSAEPSSQSVANTNKVTVPQEFNPMESSTQNITEEESEIALVSQTKPPTTNKESETLVSTTQTKQRFRKPIAVIHVVKLDCETKTLIDSLGRETLIDIVSEPQPTSTST